jgi:hypothetical protein
MFFYKFEKNNWLTPFQPNWWTNIKYEFGEKKGEEYLNYLT